MGLSAENRLRRPSEFQHVLSSTQRSRRNRSDRDDPRNVLQDNRDEIGGGRAGDRLLLVAALPNGRTESRIGLSVSKRVGGSVVRNRVKRRLREIFREFALAGQMGQAEVETGWDVVVTARPEAAEATYAELRVSAQRLVSKIRARR